jgi:hypothetical protein
MLPPIYQPFHHHQTNTAINQAAHLDLRAVATREMDTVAVAAELHLPHPLFLLSLNHLKALLAPLNKWILLLATAAAETAASKVKTDTTIIVARAVAVMGEQVEEMMAMADIAVVLMMQGEVVGKEM